MYNETFKFRQIMEFYTGDNFIVVLQNIKEEIGEEKVLKPIKLSYSKMKIEEYELVPRTRNLTIFYSLRFFEKKHDKYFDVIDDLFLFIDLIEVLKSFSGNKLNTEKIYTFPNRFTAKVVRKNGNFYLKIHFENYSNYLLLDKFEASSLAAKFSKILQKCEVWQE